MRCDVRARADLITVELRHGRTTQLGIIDQERGSATLFMAEENRSWFLSQLVKMSLR